MKKNKAQLTLEAVAAVAVLLLLLVLVVVINALRDETTKELGFAYKTANECNEIALSLSLLYSEGPFSKAEFTASKNFQVGDGYVLMQGMRCDFIGKAVPANLNSGKVTAKNLNGVITIANTP
ncbi:MAG: hypothetical protein QXK06_00865 [Candidatus Diapherotrites archaeon]